MRHARSASCGAISTAAVIIIILTGTVLLSSCVSPAAKEQSVGRKKQTVPDLDIERYSGLWYEIARFPHSFEDGLVGVTAEYQLSGRGRVTVINRGYRGNFGGRLSRVRGRARVPDPSHPGRLKVYFFLFFGADYYVFDVDTGAPDYRYAIVGSSSDNYLWILSRRPIIEEELYRELVQKAEALGYNTSGLIRVPQKPLEEE
jgi:apolipoprotein D and lipocalin family protein